MKTFNEFISEATSKGATISKKDIDHIRSLTDDNYHGDAIAHGAKVLGRKDLHDAVQDINQEHDKAGYLTQELSDRRRVVYGKVMSHAKDTLTPKSFAAFHGSY